MSGTDSRPRQDPQIGTRWAMVGAGASEMPLFRQYWGGTNARYRGSSGGIFRLTDVPADNRPTALSECVDGFSALIPYVFGLFERNPVTTAPTAMTSLPYWVWAHSVTRPTESEFEQAGLRLGPAERPQGRKADLSWMVAPGQITLRGVALFRGRRRI